MTNLSIITDFLNHMGDAILLADESSRIIFANHSCTKLFKYSAENINKLTLDELMVLPKNISHKQLVNNYVRSKSEARTMINRRAFPCINALGEQFNARISISSVNIDNQSYGVALIQDFSTILEEIKQLEVSSNTDTLTGLYNRRYLDSLLRKDSRILLSWESIGVIYIDLDKFKPINDIYGHDIGDAVLQVISKRIRTSIRFNDIAFRLGGDEFLVFLNLTNIKNINKVLKSATQKILNNIKESIKTKHSTFSVGVSAGCGIYPNHDSDLAELINKTDKAMYLAKRLDSDNKIKFLNET